MQLEFSNMAICQQCTSYFIAIFNIMGCLPSIIKYGQAITLILNVVNSKCHIEFVLQKASQNDQITHKFKITQQVEPIIQIYGGGLSIVSNLWRFDISCYRSVATNKQNTKNLSKWHWCAHPFSPFYRK